MICGLMVLYGLIGIFSCGIYRGHERRTKDKLPAIAYVIVFFFWPIIWAWAVGEAIACRQGHSH
jgi:hypothetical protein